MSIGEISAHSQLGWPILSALLAVPAVGALLALVTRDARTARRIALGAMLLVGLLSIVLVSAFQDGSAKMQFVERLAWMPAMGIHYQLGVDGISVLFVPLTALVFLGMLLGAGQIKTGERLFLANLLLLEMATLGIYLALDLVLFFCFFELALLPSFWLIKLWGLGPQRQAAASRYLIYMLLGSLPILIGFVLLGLGHGESGPTFDLVALLARPVDLELQYLVFGLLAVGFAVKGPALPFHTWMPVAAMEGPICMGAYLLGLKVGAYGFLRFVLPLTPDASQELAWLVIALELFAILYAGLLALVQMNFRRLLAFASVSHVGLIMVAAFSMNQQAWQGALLLMVNAGIATAGLFLCAGFLHRRLGSTDLQAMGGLARSYPRLATFCFVAGLALIGVPGTSGFGGELLAMNGAFRVSWVYGAVAALGVILSAAYFLWFFQRAFLGPLRSSGAALRSSDLDRSETMVACVLMLAVFAVGFYPKPLVDMTGASVTAMTQRPAAASARQPAPADATTASGARRNPG